MLRRLSLLVVCLLVVAGCAGAPAAAPTGPDGPAPTPATPSAAPTGPDGPAPTPATPSAPTSSPSGVDKVLVPLTHYSLTGLLCEVAGIPPLREAARAPSFAEAFGLQLGR